MKKYNLTRISVLIVEKHPPMRTMLRQILKEFGVEKVYDTSTPEQGFEEFNESEPDLVLVDWAPDFDGLSLVHNIRTHEDSIFPQAPVIMVTAYNESNHIYEALDAGMTEYLSKPVSAKLLYLRIVSVIENKRRFIRGGDFIGPDRRRRDNAFGGDDRRGDSKEPLGPSPGGNRIAASC